MPQKKQSLILVTLSVIILSLSSCNSCSPPAPGSPGNAAKAITGTITTGKEVSAAAASIKPSGGTVAVTDPASNITGLVITVPPNAYNTTTPFKVSSAPVEKHTFGDSFNPITPLIIVDNGGVYADETIEVKIPVKIPPDYFAMGFIYDDKTGKLEGMPLVDEDENSITVATRHFSKFVISAEKKAFLLSQRDIDSGFRPGIDDWQFTNLGSYLAPDGQCGGQSMTAMWYYTTKPDGADKHLWGRYDNNGNQTATPDFDWDDSLGIRFASVIQVEERWTNISRGRTQRLSHDPEKTWLMFAYAMNLTKEPQAVEVGNSDNHTAPQYLHALVVYRILDGNLYVADPNYPGKTDRYIKYENNTFLPYNSGQNARAIASGEEISYIRMVYIGKTPMLDWNKVAQHWQEFKQGKIGNVEFPIYEIDWMGDNSTGGKLENGYVSPKDELILRIKDPSTKNITFQIFLDGELLQPIADVPVFFIKSYQLKPGSNRLGIYVTSRNEDYINFEYVDVIYKEPPKVTAPPPPAANQTAPKPAAPAVHWALQSVKLPTLPKMPIVWSDGFGDNAETLVVTETGISSVVVTTKAGREVGTSTTTLKFDKPPAEFIQGQKYDFKAIWSITGTGIPRYASSFVQLGQGDFNGELKPFNLNDNPTGTVILPLTLAYANQGFEISARLSVRGDLAKVTWYYGVK